MPKLVPGRCFPVDLLSVHEDCPSISTRAGTLMLCSMGTGHGARHAAADVDTSPELAATGAFCGRLDFDEDATASLLVVARVWD